MNHSNTQISDPFALEFGFDLDEAYPLINLTVVSIDTQSTTPSITEIGIICGVLSINDEVELVIKFMDELRQYTKTEFVSQLKIIMD
ncbi:MAG: hypothetical protein V7721_00865 [Porticoccaceae bacterium]